MLKRVIPAVLAAALAVSPAVLQSAAAAGEQSILYGDVNSDGSVDVFDPALLKHDLHSQHPDRPGGV